MLLPNLPPPVEGIHHQEANVQAFVNQRSIGVGTLFIAESRLSWMKTGTNGGLSIEYPHVAIHAVSRDTAHFPHPCLYVMLDVALEENRAAAENGHTEGDAESDPEDESSQMTELRFAPENVGVLDTMYKSLNECQVLHPVPEDHPSDEDEGVYGDAEEGDYDVAEGGHDSAADYENGMEEDGDDGGEFVDADDEDMETGQFEDAENSHS